MRRTPLLPLSVCLLTLSFSGGETVSVPSAISFSSGAEPESVALERLRVVDQYTPRAQAVGWIKQNLRDIYLFVHRQPKNHERLKAIKPLRTQLAALVDLDAAIRKFGDPRQGGKRYIVLLHDRAESFIYAWATFSRLAIDTSQSEVGPEHRRALLTPFQGVAKEQSPLALLLQLYANIRASEGEEREPLHTLLKDDYFYRNGNAYAHSWNRYIPSTVDLIGRYDAPPFLCKANREILSLWALVNLQLDTWRDQKQEQTDTLDLTSLAQWLKDFSDQTELLTTFDQSENKRGTALKDRLARLHLFIDFLNRHTTRKGLDDLLTELEKPDRQNRSPADTEAIKRLAKAAEPTQDNEFLPQAAVWLRYVTLLSYRRTGVQVIAGPSDAALTQWWAKLREKHPHVGDFQAGLKPKNPSDPGLNGFVRWNAWPEQGHIIRAIADATDAAYRYSLWEAERPALETSRYETAAKPQVREEFKKKLRQHIANLEDVYDKDLKRNFIQKAPASFDDWLFAGATVPSGNEQASRFKSPSLHDDERKRIENDLAQLAAIVTSANQVQKAIRDAYEAEDPAAISAWLQGPAALDGAARWTPFDLPQLSFQDYYRQVIRNVKQLEDEIRKKQSQADLTELYKEQVAQNEILASETALARLGLEIAIQGNQVADCLKQLAALDEKIATLKKNWTALDKRAKELGVKRAELQLGLAAQARELAKAKVEGLKEAVEGVKRLVKNAKDQLETMKPRLLEAAQKVREQKRKSGIFSILRGIVTVVGAVLTPFLGPGVFQAAMAVNQVLDVAEEASNIDFRDLGQAIKDLDRVAKKAAPLINFAIDQSGSKDLKSFRDGVNQWLRGTGQKLDQLRGDKEKKVGEFPKAFQGGRGAQDLRNLASAIGSGLPVRIENGEVKFDSGKLVIEFCGDTDLKKLLSELFQEGGMVVNTLRTDAERIAKLTGLDGINRQQALLSALDEVIRTSPPEVLALLGKHDYDSVVANVKQVRNKLKGWVEKAKAGDPALTLLAQVLGGGMTIVKDGKGKIIALSPAVNKEMAALKDRVKRFQDHWKEKTSGDYRNLFQGRLGQVNDLIRNAQRDENNLENIARSKIPEVIAQLDKDLEGLMKTINDAEDAFKDAETNFEIATLDRDASIFLRDAANLRQEAAGLDVEKAIVKERIAAINITKASLWIQQKEREVENATKRLTLNENKLRHIYATCRRWGIDPNKPKEKPQIDPLSLVGILDVDNKDLQRQHAYYLDGAAQGAVGMVQWLRILNVDRLPPTPGIAKLLPWKLVKESQAKPLPERDKWAFGEVRKVMEIRYRRDAAIQLARELEKTAEDLNDLFLEKASVSDEHLGFARAVSIRDDKIVWFDDLHPTDLLNSLPSSIKEIQALSPDRVKKMRKLQSLYRVPERGGMDTPKDGQDSEKDQQITELRRKVLGYFRFRFTLDEYDDRQRSPEFAEVQVAPNPASSYYFLLSDSTLVHERQAGTDPFPVVNLRFLIVPPDNPVGNPSQPFTGSLPNDRFLTKQLNDPLEETILLGQIRQRLQLWKKLQLIGAVGDWTVYILGTDVPNESKRQERIVDCRRNLNLTFRIPYIEVPAK